MSNAALASLADARMLYLTTTGRRSGQPRTSEIWFTCYQGRLYLNAERAYKAHWVINVIQKPRVYVRIKNQKFAGQARVLERQQDGDLWQVVAELSRQKYGWGEGLPVEIVLL
jgi:deazaflavin-dependent oxidoreductase (nitroreductase family)